MDQGLNGREFWCLRWGWWNEMRKFGYWVGGQWRNENPFTSVHMDISNQSPFWREENKLTFFQYSLSQRHAQVKKCTCPWLSSSCSSFPVSLFGPQYRFFILLVVFRIVRMSLLRVVILTHFKEVWLLSSFPHERKTTDSMAHSFPIPTHPVSCLIEGNIYLNLCFCSFLPNRSSVQEKRLFCLGPEVTDEISGNDPVRGYVMDTSSQKMISESQLCHVSSERDLQQFWGK